MTIHRTQDFIDQINETLRYPDPIRSWTFMGRVHKDAIDEMLVERKHPLAYEPGTQERRFLALARSGYQF